MTLLYIVKYFMVTKNLFINEFTDVKMREIFLLILLFESCFALAVNEPYPGQKITSDNYDDQSVTNSYSEFNLDKACYFIIIVQQLLKAY